MKKNIILLVFALILGLIAYQLVRSKGDGKSSTTTLPDRNFKVADVNTIGKISIKQPKYPPINFVRTGQGWLMNNKKEVNSFAFNDFLGLISNVVVDYIPTTIMVKNIMSDMETNGVIITIWDKSGNEIRNFVVGSEIGSPSGTPFVIKGGNQPYIMRVPGFTGSLRSRIMNKINEWETTAVYELDPSSIESIAVEYDRDEAASFIVSKNGDQFKISKPNNSSASATPNQKTAAAYFDFYREVIGEYNDSENPERKRIISGQRFAKITVTLKNGHKSEIDYFAYSDIDTKIETKSPHQIIPDNKFFAETDDNEMYLIQQRVIWRLWRTYDYFF